MATPFIPTLTQTSQPVLTDPTDVIAYLIRFFLTNPGRVSDFFDKQQLSFREVLATHTSPAQVANACEQVLTEAIDRHYPNTYGTTVTAHPMDEGHTRWRLQIAVRTAAGEPALQLTATDEDGTFHIQNGILSVNPKA